MSDTRLGRRNRRLFKQLDTITDAIDSLKQKIRDGADAAAIDNSTVVIALRSIDFIMLLRRIEHSTFYPRFRRRRADNALSAQPARKRKNAV